MWSDRESRILRGVAIWCAYYRSNPARFVRDYLHINLKLFQKVLITMMLRSTVFVFIATRGIGKTFLSAIYAVVRCILYPGTKVCIASGTRGQAITVLEKILLELKPNSPELCAEIDDKQTRLNGTNAQIVFKNGSYIKVVTAADSSRGNRANVLILDEFRLIDKNTVDTVLRKFLTQRRMPKYQALTEKERQVEYGKEKNITMYLSSAFFVDHWSYTKCTDTLKFMLDDTKHQFVCGLPYQVSIQSGLLDAETVQDEMLEADFSQVKFDMEYQALFYGASDGAFFDFESISKNRKIKYPYLPDKLASLLNNSAMIKMPPKQNGEIRLLSADIALMSSKKHNNDASAIFINQLTPTRAGRYISNIVYCDSYEGLRTEEQALQIRRLYEEYQCDYIVLDANGIGLGVFDSLASEIVDPETGEIYPALSCCNDKTMADRCTIPGAEKVIWSIKASAQFNSDCAFLLREGFRSGKIRLLVSEYDADTLLADLRGYNSLDAMQKTKLHLPYVHTTLLINELVRLQHEENNGKIKVFERAGMRKDRYSSLSYNYYVATQLEITKSKRRNASISEDQFIIKAPNQKRKAVNTVYGHKEKANRWY